MMAAGFVTYLNLRLTEDAYGEATKKDDVEYRQADVSCHSTHAILTVGVSVTGRE